MADKVKLVLLKDSFLGKEGREVDYPASYQHIAALEKDGLAKRVEATETTTEVKEQPKKKSKSK